MNSKIEYSEINTFSEFNECIELQRKIFGLSDIDIIPVAILNIIARKNPFMGLLVGIFKNTELKREMIGFSISLTSGINNSIYAIATGVLPEYQNKMYGYGVILKVRELAIENNVNTIYTLYDPLESNLGRLYMNRFGFVGTKFIENAYQLDDEVTLVDEIPNDKILVEWDPVSETTINKINGDFKHLRLNEALEKYPVVDNIKSIKDSSVLVKIPENFKDIKIKNPSLAKNYRNKVRPIFRRYINDYNFKLTNSFTGKINKQRYTYYLLEK